MEKFSCNGIDQYNRSFTCCLLDCKTSNADSCTSFTGQCTTIYIIYNITELPEYSKLIYTYNCNSNQVNCDAKKYMSTIDCWINDLDINTIEFEYQGRIRPAGVIVVIVFGAISLLATICTCIEKLRT